MIDLFGRCPACGTLWASAVICRGELMCAATTRAVLHHERRYSKERGWHSILAKIECPSCHRMFPTEPPPSIAA